MNSTDKKRLLFRRRDVVKTLLALGAGGVFYRYTGSWDDDGVLSAVAAPPDGSTPSLEIFAALSRLVTLHDDLNAGVTRKMHDVFMKEPWGPDHIMRVHKKIMSALGSGKINSATPLDDASWAFDDGEKWFVGHLLTTWYLGIYYHENTAPQMITYEHALMFSPVKGVIPIPFVGNTPYGTWSEPPEGLK